MSIRIGVALGLSLALLALLLWLGFWQLERAAYKDSMQASFRDALGAPPADPVVLLASGASQVWRYRRTRVLGRPVAGRQYLLDNRTHGGRAGYHVLTVVSQGRHGVVVNRGWVPAGPDRSHLPPVTVPDSDVQYDGRLVPPPRTGLLLGDDGYGDASWPKVVQRVALQTMSEQLGLPLLPAVVLLEPGHPQCMVCEWKPGGAITADRHRGYAVQWFALAATLVLLLAVAAGLKARRRG
jgi:surfeit locus 1 family protein